jgi:glycolate oxidase iron-sulfur subunit
MSGATTSHIAKSAFRGIDIPSGDVLISCMHCGLCLPTCPTYSLTGLERSSPRGRIRLIKAVAEGDLKITRGFVEEMNFCLDCQACETACPAGVKYGSLVEAARAQIFSHRHESLPSWLIKKVFMSWFFAAKKRFHLLAKFLRFYQRSGIQWLLDKSRILALVSPKLAKLQPLTPAISSRFSSDVLSEVMPAYGDKKRRVGFLTGCIMDVAYADVNLDTVELLREHGCDVVIPKKGNCCGSLHAHNGDMESARQFARTIISVFSSSDVETIVMNSAGCGAYMKEYGHIFHDDVELRQAAAEVSAKTKDLTEFLLEIGFKGSREHRQTTPSAFQGKRITYHDACHLVHTQKIASQPRTLIQSIPGLDYAELPESSWCCGSAGIYNIVRYDDSMKLLERKVERIQSIAPDIVVTGNPGCMVQIAHGLRTKGLSVELMHTATFLRKACEA